MIGNKKKSKKRTYTFSSRIFFYIVPWTAAIILVVATFFFWYLFDTFKTEKIKSTEIIISEKANHFENYFKEIKATLAYVASVPGITTALNTYQDMNARQKYEINNEIDDYLSGINIFKSYLEDVIIIGNNGYCKNLGSSSLFKVDVNPMEWESIKNYKPAENSSFAYVLPYEADYYASMPHKVFSVVLPVYKRGEIIGYIQGNMNYEEVLERFQTAENVEEIEFSAVNDEGCKVFSADESQIGSKVEEAYIERMEGEKGTFFIQNEMTVFQRSDVTNWIFCATIGYDTLMRPGYTAAKVLLLGVLPLSIMIMGVAILILTKKIKKPLNMLMRRVEEVKPENYVRVAADYKVQEIEVLGDKFEQAMERIHDLIQHVYQAEIRKKKTEFEVLRNQITPHFMYNSLQLIKAEAVIARNKDISQIVTSLANLLRYSMDSRSEIVIVRDEISYIRDYLELYRRRYIDKFNYELVIEPALWECRIPKLILQPLVENSILHGFETKRRDGVIRVSGKIDGVYGIFEIYDNGQGIEDSTKTQMMEEFQNMGSEDSGIGMYNVHQRIKLQCGEECGIIEIASKKNQFTEIIVRTRVLS